MVDEQLAESYNSRVRVDLNNIKKMTPAQLDRVKSYGSAAENLLQNRDFAQFIHHYKFDLSDQIASITAHSPEDNERRVALCNYLSGIDGFIASLQRAKYFKDKVVTQQVKEQGPTE